MSPKVADCKERAELLAALTAAIEAAISVNNRLLEAAIVGNLGELNALNAELRKTRACKDNLMQAYCQHVSEHGC
jgi:hypothetical protein